MTVIMEATSSPEIPSIPSKPTTITPAQRVFGITELLEMILIESATDLPAKHLFEWQRINCTFRNTIARSKLLRQFMLLDRLTESAVRIKHDRPPLDAGSRRHMIDIANRGLLGILCPGPNPGFWLTPQIQHFHRVSFGRLKPLRIKASHTHVDEPYFDNFVHRRVGEDISWRNMKLQIQDGCTHFLLRQQVIIETPWKRSWPEQTYEYDFLFEGPTLTAGDLKDTLVAMLKRNYRRHCLVAVDRRFGLSRRTVELVRVFPCPCKNELMIVGEYTIRERMKRNGRPLHRRWWDWRSWFARYLLCL